MSEFRKFSIGFFAGSCGLASWINHGGSISPSASGPDGLILCGLVAGSLAVLLFGDRP